MILEFFLLVLEHLFFILKVPSGGIAVSAVWMVDGGRVSTDVRWTRGLTDLLVLDD